MKALLLLKAAVQGGTWFSRGGFIELKKRTQVWILPVAGGGILIGAVAFMVILVSNYRGLLIIGVQIGHPELLFFSSLLVSLLLEFFIGIPTTISVLYYSRDTRLLMSLPVKGADIALAKGMQLYGYLLPIHLLMFIPAAAVSAGGIPLTIYFWTSVFIQSCIGPLIPIGLAVMFVAILMRVVNLSRARTAIEVIGMVIGIGIAVLIQFAVMRSIGISGDPGEAVGNIAGYVTLLIRRLPPLKWAALGFFHGGAGFLVLTTAVSILVFIGALFLIRKRFLLDVTARSEERVVLPKKRAHNKLKRRSPIRALMGREWMILKSNSTFIFESIGEVLIFPILLFMFSVIVPNELRKSVFSVLSSVPYYQLLGFGALIMLTLINTVAATSLSREGKAFALSLSLPITPRQQVLSKLYFQLVLFYPVYLLNMLLLVYLMRLPVAVIAYLAPGGFGFILLVFYIGLFSDLRRPVLHWSHPRQAVKQNMNVLAAVGFGFLLASTSAGICYLLLKIGLSQYMAACVIAGLALIGGIGIRRPVLQYAKRSYLQRLEM